MDFNLTSVILGLAGVIIGFVLKSTYDYFLYLKERHDKYFFALLSKRFETYQEANYECEKLKKVVHDKTDKKYQITQDAREWFYRNNLYLSPELRNDFKMLIMDVEFYGDTLEDVRFTSIEQGAKAEETQQKRKELYEKWNNIMVGTQAKLQKDIDKYYEKLK